MFLSFSAAENKLSAVQSTPVSEDIVTQDQRYLSPLLSFHLAELSSSSTGDNGRQSLLGDRGGSGLGDG